MFLLENLPVEWLNLRLHAIKSDWRNPDTLSSLGRLQCWPGIGKSFAGFLSCLRPTAAANPTVAVLERAQAQASMCQLVGDNTNVPRLRVLVLIDHHSDKR